MAIKLDAKADATIATAAARAGMGAVPKDMSKSFQGIATGYASTMKVFGEYGAKVAQTIGQIAAPLVEDSVEKLMLGQQGFYDRKGIPEGLSGPIIADIEEAKTNKPNRRNKTKPEGVSEEDWWYQTNDAGELEFDKQKFKIAKGKWRQGINEIYNEGQQLRKGIFDNVQKVAAGDINAEGTGAKRLYQYSALKEEGRGITNGDEKHKGSRIVTGKNDQGEYGFNFKDASGNLVYDVLEDGTLVTKPKNEGDKPMFLSKGDMGSLITTQDLDIDIAVGEVKANIIKIAKTKGAENITQSEYDEEVNAFSKSIPTDNKFNHATNTVLFGRETYAQTLTKPNSITQEMFIAINGENQLGLTDTDGEEGIGLGDLTNNVNMAIMRRELLNPKNPAARKIFLNYYEQGLRGVATDAGTRYTPPTLTGDKDPIEVAPFANNQQFKGGVLGSNLNQYYDKLNSGSIKLKGGGSIDLQEGGMWKNSKTGKQYSGAQVLDLFQQDLEANYPKSNIKLDRLSQFDIFKTGGETSDEKADPLKEKTIGQIMTIFPELSREEAEKRYNIMEGFTNPKKLP